MKGIPKETEVTASHALRRFRLSSHALLSMQSTVYAGEREQAQVLGLVQINDELYKPSSGDIAFLKATTGIRDEEDLKEHVNKIQREAFKVYPYPCIIFYEFIRPHIANLRAYSSLLQLGRERKGAIFVDLGCGFGNNVQKVVLDGWLTDNCIATDLRKVFWEFGNRLFCSSAANFSIPFIQGNILDQHFVDERPPLPTSTAPPSPRPANLTSLTSLHVLRGHVHAFFAGYFFHLFSHADQARIARTLAGLLSPEPGAMILGVQISTGKRGPLPLTPEYTLMSHSEQTWREMWEQAFGGCDVNVAISMRSHSGGPSAHGLATVTESAELYVMEWTVSRR